MRKREVVAAVAALAVGCLTAGALVFQPWLLFVDVKVNDALPVVVDTMTTPGSAGTEVGKPRTGPIQLLAGELVSHDHDTSGTVRIIEHLDGSRTLSLENLATTNGPDVHVWLSSAPVDDRVLAGGSPHVDLGIIKGNLGNQLYDIPADLELSQFPSIYLWCEQFSSPFGAAALA